jgi:hypothetical protein
MLSPGEFSFCVKDTAIVIQVKISGCPDHGGLNKRNYIFVCSINAVILLFFANKSMEGLFAPDFHGFVAQAGEELTLGQPW